MEFRQEKAQKLDNLFMRLQHNDDPSILKYVEAAIWETWLQSGSSDIDELMEVGIDALAQHDYTKAVACFTDVIALAPDYAEGWNKRATVYYVRGEFKRSLEDIAQVLALEPRHFGALSGIASIYSEIQHPMGTLRALESIYEIFPEKPDLKDQLNHLYEKLGMK